MADTGSITINVRTLKTNNTFWFNKNCTKTKPFTIKTENKFGSKTFKNLSPGEYYFVISKSRGWRVIKQVCIAKKWTVGPSSRHIVINLQPGEHATCTYTNEYRVCC